MDTIANDFGLRKIIYEPLIEEPKNLLKTLPESLSRELMTLPDKVLRRILNTPIGVEVEVEGYTRRMELDGWNVTEDNSLRNHGAELISRLGYRAHHIWPILNTVCKIGKANKWSVSDRTSIHVHLGMNHLTMGDVHALLLTYIPLEEALFEYAGALRYSNIFCVPASECSGGLSYDCKDIRGYIQEADKYSALNFKTVRELGTVEFRHMQTCFDPEYIYRWIMMLCLIRDYARRIPIEQIKTFITDLRTKQNCREYVSSIFFGLAERLPFNQEAMRRLATEARFHFFSGEQ